MGRVTTMTLAVLGGALLAGGGAEAVPAARAGQARESIRAAGFLRPEAHLQLSARSAGLVVEVRHLEGDRVGPGEPVVLLDDTEAQLESALAKADLETAEVTLAKVASGPRPEDLERAKAFYEEGKAGLELADRTLKSDVELHQGGILSDLGRRRSERMLEAAKAVAEARRLDLVILEKGARPEDIRLMEIEVERQKARLAMKEREAARTRIAGRRQGTGYVARVWVEEGQWVEAGRVVAELVYMDRLRVELDLSADAVAGLEKGAKAVVRSPLHPGRELVGRITRLSPVTDPASGTVRAVVEVENTDRVFRPGQEAEVEIPR